MKLTLFMNVLLISTLSILAVGCGKDKKKSNNDQYYYNPYVTGQQPTASGATAQAALTNYLNAIEPNQSLLGSVVVQKSRYSCTTKDFLGISFLPVNLCRYSQVSNPAAYVVLNQPRRLVNPALNNLLVPVGGYSLGNIVQYGSLIQIEHYLGNETIQYTIEMSRHAISNPTIIKDTAAQRIDSVVYPSL
jgi:Flp pilus assembly protein TadG